MYKLIRCITNFQQIDKNILVYINIVITNKFGWILK